MDRTGMNLYALYGFLLLGFGMASVHDVMVLGAGPALLTADKGIARKCVYNRDYSMLLADCSKLNLQEIPKDLRTGIQVLDFSTNRVRRLTNDSLSPYRSLAFVYLSDNFIQHIDEDTFGGQYYLQVLDLTKNGCDSLPRSLFQLPYLRTFRAAENNLADSAFSFPVTSPLSVLDLSRNRLTRIPDLGPFPTLVHLNLSENAIGSVSAADLARFCSLQVLDLTGNPVRFNESDCGCRAFNSWLAARRIAFKPGFNCTDAADRCADARFDNRTLELHDECANVLKVRAQAEKARSTWILVACCVSALIVCVFVALCCVHKRNKRRRRMLKEQQRLKMNNANTELLNSNLRAEPVE